MTYHAFGLSIQSDVPCPELPPGDASPDVVVRYGRVPPALDDCTARGICYQVAPGRALIVLESAGRFLVEAGRTITIERAPGADDASVRLFLLGLCFGLLLHQRGRLVLHAGAVARDGRCIALAGPSSTGKSTLAAAFVRRGYTLVTDEVCVLDAGTDGAPAVVPGYPALLLWKSALQRLALFDETLERVRPTLEKYVWPVPDRFANRPVRLSHLYTLATWNREEVEMTPLRGFDRFQAFLDQTFREPYLNGLGLATSRQQRCAAIVPHVAAHRLTWPQRWTDLDEVIDRIERDAFAVAPAHAA